MLLKSRPPALVPMLLLPLLLVAGCASPRLPLPPAVVAPPRIPPLPQEARQPPTPAWCSPTCSDGWRREAETWQSLLTRAAGPGQPASTPGTR